MRGPDTSHAQDPLTSATNWHSAWASIYHHDSSDPTSFDTAEAQKDLAHFKQWVNLKNHNSTKLDRAFKHHEIREAMAGLKNFKRHGSHGLPPDLL